MRNVWFGLMIGAATGAAIGISLDLGHQAGRRAGQAADAARQALHDHGPELAAAVTNTAARSAEKIKAADLPGKARDLAHRANQSAAADTARQTVHTLADNAQDTGGKLAGQIQEAADTVRAKVEN